MEFSEYVNVTFDKNKNEEKGENGFIYFVNTTEGHIYEIQNPIKKIKENGSKKEIKTYQITLKK